MTSKPAFPPPPGQGEPPPPPHYVLTLYLTGSAAASARAVVNTRRFCERFLAPNYELQIIDIALQPQRLQQAQIVAAPTLVKTLPLPERRFIGDMSDVERLRIGFGLRAADPGTSG